MNILFCNDPLNPKKVDIDYLAEFEACKRLGFAVGLVDLEALINNDINAAIKFVRETNSAEYSLYRGWMVRPDSYESMFNGLNHKNIQLINSPAAYRHCHYLPESYEVIEGFTPQTKWIEKDHLASDEILQAIMSFGNSPIIIKDYVKSRKHEWAEACYIPDASDYDHARFVINNFVKRQGEELNGGLVLRKFIKLEFLVEHSKSNMPLSKEIRIFFFMGEPIFYVNYWEEGTYNEGFAYSDIEHLLQAGRKVRSKFFTMDVAKTVSGDWIIIELGDGQVSGLPENTDIERFYSAIKKEAQDKMIW